MLKHHCFLFILFALFISANPAYGAKHQAILPSESVDAHYHLMWDKANDTLQVALCYRGLAAITLTNHSTKQSAYTRSFIQAGTTLNIHGSQVTTHGKASPNECVYYEVDVSTTSDWRNTLKSHGAIVLNTKRWFWFDPAFRHAEFTITDKTGERIQAFLPFKKVGMHYQISETGLEWDSRTLLGEIKTETLHLHNTSLDVAIAGSATSRSNDWLSWLNVTAQAIESVYGRFPQTNVKVLIIPIGKRSGPTPWGEVQRGGYPSVHFFIDQTRPLEEFIADWTGSHELSHLFLPKLIPGARWMSEGIASYYQYVARARTGLITPHTAWRKLTQGFERGRRDFNQRALIRANKTMHVYWGGAAYFLLADIALRKQGSSLDKVLEAFSRCCLPSFERWSPQRVAKQLDTLSNTTVFTQLLKKEASLRQFPLSKPHEAALNLNQKERLDAIFTTGKVALTKG
ncbi:hypothetical protein [Alteromonas sp. a30]|uniref:hypothetical protein n=1 Tax=Alteromonas sp. a30 TaxID=2730917 RepID=UPI002281BB56|nr:hypothetical protein [Alteromonas sp. a30]MCY7296676.1 hypothetical protein [Alteromonas sp. a30]